MLAAVIMAGGQGKRLWPLSRKQTPKQLLPLVTKQPMLVETYQRLQGQVKTENIFIIADAQTAIKSKKIIPEIPPTNIITEPVGRNTASCIALAAFLVGASLGEDTILAIFSADAHIGDIKTFNKLLEYGTEVVEKYPDNLFTVGHKPSRADSGYGHIHLGAEVDKRDNISLHPIKAFVEKPSIEKAEAMMLSGDYAWNCGIFLWKVKTIKKALREFLPATYQAFEKYQHNFKEGMKPEILTKFYPGLEDISIDYAVLEKCPERIMSLYCSFEWDDVGSWLALERYIKPDENNNFIRGECCGLETKNCLVISQEGAMVGTLGVENLVIIQTPDALLVAHKDKIKDIKTLLKEIEKDKNLIKYL